MTLGDIKKLLDDNSVASVGKSEELVNKARDELTKLKKEKKKLSFKDLKKKIPSVLKLLKKRTHVKDSIDMIEDEYNFWTEMEASDMKESVTDILFGLPSMVGLKELFYGNKYEAKKQIPKKFNAKRYKWFVGVMPGGLTSVTRGKQNTL